jgi:eukaryotic-like serine/threonine-protein kinase
MTRRGAPWWLIVAAASFLAYFALLLYCDINRPEPVGFRVDFRADGVYVDTVAPGSPAHAAGLQHGDRIAVARGLPVRDREDWLAVDGLLEPGSEITIVVERAGTQIPLRSRLGGESPSFWRTPAGAVLLVVRLAQLATLAIALLVAFKRPRDPLALLGAWLMASAGVFCIVFPSGIAAVWQRLPLPIGALLWFPFASSIGIGVILFAFFASFPRPLLSQRWLAASAIPAAILIAEFVWSYGRIVYSPTVMARPPHMRMVMGMAASYTLLGLMVLALNYRRLDDLNERRRVRVIVPGSLIGVLSGFMIVTGYWGRSPANMTEPLFASPSMVIGVLLLLALPASFAYAILRRRLFDLSMLIRQGVRYALARRVVLSLVPLVAAVLVADIAWQGEKSLREVVAARRTLYLALIGVALFAHVRRDRWLAALDLQFFRDRHDAQRLLQQVTESLHAAGSLEAVAPHVVAQIEAAFHPQFAALMVRAPDDQFFRPLASAPAGAAPAPLGSDSKLVALARVIAGPVRLGRDADAMLVRHLPLSERAFVHEARVELLVPVCPGSGRNEALLLLGLKRSEEPYSDEDVDLLTAVSSALALALERPRSTADAAGHFEECPVCGVCYDAGTGVCARDHEALESGSTEHLLAGRYRLDHRLGEGGMGKVYFAVDISLTRPVAVKLLRERWTQSASSAEHFQREARIAASFTHPNVVTVHDFGATADGHAFLVMEVLEGDTLRAELGRAGRLDLATASHILHGVCAAVDAAHRRGLVHADLKPENVFIVRNDIAEVVKVLDFGLASSVMRARDDTRSGALLFGTPAYMAPEQLRNEPPQPAWDIWAIGVIAYELLTGVHPFSPLAGSWPAPLDARLSGTLASMRPFFARALAVDAAGRPASARLFLDEFMQAAAGARSLVGS